MSRNPKCDITANEATFQESLSKWINTNNDTYWKTMFDCVYKCCYNIAISIYRKRCFIAEQDVLDEVTTNATIRIMTAIKNEGIRPDKLSSYCYLWTLAFVNGWKSIEAEDKRFTNLMNANLLPYYNEYYRDYTESWEDRLIDEIDSTSDNF